MRLPTKALDLTEHIYQCAANGEPGAWNSAYRHFADLLSSGPGGLTVISDSDQLHILSTTMPDEGVRDYLNYFRPLSPIYQRVVLAREGEYLERRHIVCDADFQNSEIYQEFYRRYDIFDCDYTCLLERDGLNAGIGFSRPRGNREFSKKEVATRNFLIPHLKRALEMQYAFSKATRSAGAILAALDSMRRGVLIVDRNSTVLYMNKSAERTARAKDGISITPKGALTTGRVAETARLQAALTSLFSEQLDATPTWADSLFISRASGMRPLHVSITRFTDREFTHFRRGVLALIVVYDPETRRRTSAAMLSESYGLTAAESRVSILLAQGLSVREIARRLDIQQNTVRTHLKSVFLKTETSRQSELITLVNNSPTDLDLDR